MKVTDLKENECIHCKTEEQANAICKLMHEAGLKWINSDSYLAKNEYMSYTSRICYFPKEGTFCSLNYAKQINCKIYKAEQFLKQKKETMNTIVNINPDTSEINITPQEGFEIDVENSDLKNGKVILKEVEKKYPDRFIMPKVMNMEELFFSEIYARKLDILDTLLCLRDEYNRIDGLEEGFRFEDINYCIETYNNQLLINKWKNSNRIMHFGKEETAELFLKNFEEQLEQIKEFL